MSYPTPPSTKQVPGLREDPNVLASRELFFSNDPSAMLADMRRFLLAELHRLLSQAKFERDPFSQHHLHEFADTVLATGPLNSYLLQLAHRETIGRVTRCFYAEYLDYTRNASIQPAWPAHSLYIDAVCEPDVPRAHKLTSIVNDLRLVLRGIVSEERRRWSVASDDAWAKELFAKLLKPIPLRPDLKEELGRSVSTMDLGEVERIDEKLMLLYYMGDEASV